MMPSDERRLAALERRFAKAASAEINRGNTVMGETPANGRVAKGHFAAGNAIAKGNVGNARMKALRRALIECVTPEKVAEVEASLYKLAIDGDVSAARVWLDHVIGRPVQAVELSGGDGGPLGMEVVMATVMTALAPFPEARLAVAAKLKGVDRGHDDGPGDRAGN
jgi:hypothetical protein